MAILSFQKPDKVTLLEADATFGRFEFKPLEPGYGITIGNALRRILLSSLEGYAISSIRISGVQHEFDTIPGVKEDVTNMILNIKKIDLIQTVEGEDTDAATITVGPGKETFTAGDLNEVLTNFQVLNADQVICHLDPTASFTLDITVNKGRGWVPADENVVPGNDVNIIAIDSIYTPIKNVKIAIENFRVDQKTDYEKLTLEILTNGSIAPQEALKEAAKILIQHFALFSDELIAVETPEEVTTDEFDEDVLKMRQLLKSKLVDLELSVRALNCLKSAEVETLGELVKLDKSDLLKFRNFGKKSLTELDDLLARLNLNFGMDIAKYKLDKE